MAKSSIVRKLTNHRPPGSLPAEKAIEGFLNYKTAEGLSERTVESHQRQL